VWRWRSFSCAFSVSLIALKSSHGTLSGANAINVLRENGYALTILDDLVRSDALRIVGGSLEFAHEALGDYLRALLLSQKDSASLIDELATIELDTDSLFPILLSAVLERHGIQQVLFHRLAQLDLSAYFDALRYRADVSAEILVCSAPSTKHHLSALLQEYGQVQHCLDMRPVMFWRTAAPIPGRCKAIWGIDQFRVRSGTQN
jgi:hypothetical protein